MYPKKPIDISESFDKETFDDWLNCFDVLLSDCDGVLWLHDTLYDGSKEAINKFIELGKKVYLITNNSQTTREQMAEKCKKFGFNLELENMVATSHATAQYLKSIGFDKKAYVIGGKTIVGELDAVGIKSIGSGPDNVENSLQEHVYTAIKTMDKEVGAVVVAFDEYYGFPKLFKAVNYLRNPAVKFIATNDDEKVDFPQFTFPDAGCTIAAIEKASERKVEVIGKPSKLLTEIALKHEMHRDSNRFLMIGDRLNTDVLFGKRNNFKTMLVGTGVHQMKDVQEIIDKIKRGEGSEEDESMIPDYYVSAMKNLFK